MYGGLLLDTILYTCTMLMFFYCTVALVLMLNKCENVSQKMETAAMQHAPFLSCILSLLIIWIKPIYWLMHIKYWYRKVEKKKKKKKKHTGGVEFKKCVINSWN